MEADREAAIGQLTLHVERALYEADRAERRYRSVEPENRLVARTLEREWENKLAELAQAKGELEERRRLCDRCGSPMKVLAVIMDPVEVDKILRHLIKTGRAPPGLDQPLKT